MADDDYLFDEDPSEEGEDDLAPADLKAIEQTAVYSSDWTSETIVGQLRRGNIELSPSFQRRDAWRDDRKSAFIESLFLGLPIPQIVLAETKDRRGGFLVIDGKQRLTALWRFAAAPEDDIDPLRLTGLQVRKDLNGLTLAAMEERADLADDIAFFQNQTVRTVVLRAWPNDDFLYRVFLRLNTGSVKLAPQELRQALIPGPFVRFAEERSGESVSIRKTLNLKAPDFRMRDAELLVRYFAFANFLPRYTGNLKEFLDDTCRRLNSMWADHDERIRQDADRCDLAIDATFEIFGDDAFRRWNGSRYEGRFNRAIFDVMVFYFRRPSVARAARDRAGAVVDAYRRISEDDPDFVEAVQSTTKTIGATHGRLAKWGEALSDALDEDLAIPELGDDNRIRLPS
jgi:hypothetical protein